MRHEEVGEYAALYALGALDERLQAEVDEHIAACTPCAQAIGRAEQDVTLMAAAQVQYDAPAALAERLRRTMIRDDIPSIAPRARRPSPWPLITAIAAAFVIGIVPSAYLWQQNRSMHATMLADSAAMGLLASRPHRMTRFAGMSGQSQAQVMYAPDGSWYVVLVRDVSKTLQVAWMHDGEKTMLGDAVPHGEVAMLYLPKSHRMDQLALMDGDQTVAVAQLTY